MNDYTVHQLLYRDVSFLMWSSRYKFGCTGLAISRHFPGQNVIDVLRKSHKYGNSTCCILPAHRICPNNPPRILLYCWIATLPIWWAELGGTWRLPLTFVLLFPLCGECGDLIVIIIIHDLSTTKFSRHDFALVVGSFAVVCSKAAPTEEYQIKMTFWNMFWFINWFNSCKIT